VFLEGAGAEARLNGIYYVKEGKHMDMRTVQYHLQRAGQSRAFFKGAVSANGRSIYQGLIDVDENAPGTDAYLTNKNLILNDGARADSIPCLEIRTDDVKCSHGSTTGKLDEEELFYLMSRGLSRTEAKKELIGGFFEELIEKAPEPERESIRSKILDLIG
jgi:Fe-S cluster assembly protein SufD